MYSQTCRNWLKNNIVIAQLSNLSMHDYQRLQKSMSDNVLTFQPDDEIGNFICLSLRVRLMIAPFSQENNIWKIVSSAVWVKVEQADKIRTAAVGLRFTYSEFMKNKISEKNIATAHS